MSELRFHSNNSTAMWAPGTTQQSAVVFSYELSQENGSTIQSSRLTGTELHLPGLEEGKTYILDVWENCYGQWESEHSSLCIEGANSSLQPLVRAAGPDQSQGQFETSLVWQVFIMFVNHLWSLNLIQCVIPVELQVDSSSIGLTLVLPWSLPDDFQNDASEPRAKVEKMFKEKVREKVLFTTVITYQTSGVHPTCRRSCTNLDRNERFCVFRN